MNKNTEPLNLDLKMQRRQVGQDAWVLKPQGSIDSSTSSDLKNSMQKLFEDAQSPSHFLLDMEGVRYISSIGLGTLIGFLKRSQEKKMTFGLYDTQRPVQRVLEISKLDFLLIKPESLDNTHPFADYIRAEEIGRAKKRQTAAPDNTKNGRRL